MTDAAPAHVRDVEQAVNAVQINERAEIGDVLDRALADVARRHLAQNLRALRGAFGFDQFAAGENDVLPFLVNFNDLEFVSVADETRQILRRSHVNLRRGQERLDADVDDQPALDDGRDLALDDAAFVADGQNVVPVLFELRLLVREDDGAFLVFELLDEDINQVADFHGLQIDEFAAGDDAFAFVADVHEDFVLAKFDDGAFDDFALGKTRGALLHGFFHCEHNITVLNCGRLFVPKLRNLKTPLPNDQTLQTGNGG